MNAVPVVSLREITEHNRTAVEALAVTEEQSYYVASVTSRCRMLRSIPMPRPGIGRCTPTTSPLGLS